MKTQQPEALRLAAELRAGKWTPNILQNEAALRDRAAGELQISHAENESLRASYETLRAGYDAARLEIASLRTQMEAVGAGGVEPLRKRPVFGLPGTRDVDVAAAQKAWDAAQAQPAAQAASHVGESHFESWYAQECDKGWGTQKQLARDAYAAGMGDSAAQAAPVDAAVQQDAARLINWFDEEDGFSQGTKAPHKWVLQAHSELIRLRDAAIALATPAQAIQQDAERYRWLRDNRSWQVLHRIRPGKSIEYRMRDDGDWWGHWWPTHEQAIDAARAAQEKK